MGKIAYRRNRRRPRRNPTLLTLVNPSKSGPKAKSKAKAKVSATAKKQVAAAKKQAAVAKKAAAKATRTAKQIEKASAAIKKQLAAAKKSYVKVPGGQFKKTRKGLSKTGKPTTWKLPARGFHRVSSRGRGPHSAEGYWRFQPNAGGAMKGRRRRVVRRKARKPSWMSNPYFGKRRARKNAPKRKPLRKRSRKAAPKKALKRKSVRKSTRRAAPRKARKSTRRKGMKRNPSRRRRFGKKGRKNASRRKYRRNPVKGNVAMKQAAAGFVGFLFGRVVNNVMARHVVPMLPESIAPMAPLLGTGAGLALAYYLPKKVKKIGPISLQKYSTALLVGAGVAFLDVLLSTLAPHLPSSVTQYLAPPAPVALPGGASGFGSVWPQSFGHEAVGYASNPMLPGRQYGVQMGEYVRSPMGEYVTGVGEYVADNLDAGVISDGLYGDPGDDDLDIEVLD